MFPSTKPPESFKEILKDASKLIIPPRPLTPQSLKPFVIVHDPVTRQIYSTLPPVPPPPLPLQQSYSLSPKRPVKREAWPHDNAIEIYSHVLRLKDQYPRSTNKVREFTAKTSNFLIFRTLVTTEERTMSEFAEGWYIVKSGGQVPGSGLGRGDDAGGLEDVAKSGREKCRKIWKGMNMDYIEGEEEED
jgi:hypothetical protein